MERYEKERFVMNFEEIEQLKREISYLKRRLGDDTNSDDMIQNFSERLEIAQRRLEDATVGSLVNPEQPAEPVRPVLTPMPNIPGSGVGGGGDDGVNVTQPYDEYYSEYGSDDDISGYEHGVEKKISKGGGTLFDARTFIKSIKPRVSSKVAKFSYDRGALSTSAKSEISNILGITKELNHDSKVLEALSDPSLYLAKKLRDKRRIDELILSGFEKDLATFKGLGMGDDEAISRAKSVASQKRSSLMAVHNLNYPTEANSLARRVAEQRSN